MLCLTLVTAPFAPAQWRTSQDAEICITGTGQRSLDIPVCTRALRGEGLSALDRASVHTARGKALRGAGKLAAAIADFDAAVELNPDSADAFHERAVTRDVSGDYREALNDFRRALALSPRFAAAYRSRGLAHFYAGLSSGASCTTWPAEVDTPPAISDVHMRWRHSTRISPSGVT
jgi:lipoprotein NlpI